MRNYLILMPASLIVLAAALIQPTTEAMQTKKAVSKTISFDMYKGKTYESGVYDYTSAQVEIVVEKVSKRGRVIVWQKTFDARLLKQYPSLGQAQREQVTIPGILERREHLEVNYVLTYDTKGSEFQLQSGVFTANTNDTININI